MKAPVLSRRRRVLANAFNVEEYRKSAQKVLPAGIFDYLDGGSEDEVTLRRNRAVFDSWALMPSWGPVSGPDTSTTLLGKGSALPLTLTPTGATRLFHPDGELAVAAAADRARIPYGLAGLSTVAMETIAESHPALDRWFNFGLTSDAQALKDKLARCEAAGIQHPDCRRRHAGAGIQGAGPAQRLHRPARADAVNHRGHRPAARLVDQLPQIRRHQLPEPGSAQCRGHLRGHPVHVAAHPGPLGCHQRMEGTGSLAAGLARQDRAQGLRQPGRRRKGRPASAWMPSS